MARKEDVIIMRISGEFKTFLKKKAKEKGVSLSKHIEERLYDTYKADKEQILNLIAKRKQERPKLWAELDKSPIVREFEDYIPSLFTEFVNPLSKDPKYQPTILIGWIRHILTQTIKHFDSVDEEYKREAADRFMGIGQILIEAMSQIKSQDKKTQEEIINLKAEFAERAIYHFTALAFAKDSYSKAKLEIEKVRNELVQELKKKPGIKE